jgi:diguanylate cyclase (GGDEF)-like protein
VAERARTQGETEGLARLTALHRAGLAVIRQRDLAAVTATVIHELAHTLGYHHVSIYLWDGATLRLRDQHGYATPAPTIPPNVGVIGRVFRTGEGALVSDPAADPDFFFADAEVRSQVGVPVCDGERVCGVVSVESTALLDERDYELLELFAQQIGVAITTARLHAALVRAAWTDPLTETLNRAALLSGIEGMVTQAAASGGTLALLFVDLDRFKALNDGQGHRAGDQALAWCAARMRAHLPPGGILGRYGGEEFVLVAPGADEAAGSALAERIRAEIAAGAPVGGPGAARITVSIGVAAYPRAGNEMDALLRAADAALYRAKARGRNRVERAGSRGADGELTSPAASSAGSKRDG